MNFVTRSNPRRRRRHSHFGMPSQLRQYLSQLSRVLRPASKHMACWFSNSPLDSTTSTTQPLYLNIAHRSCRQVAHIWCPIPMTSPGAVTRKWAFDSIMISWALRISRFAGIRFRPNLAVAQRVVIAIWDWPASRNHEIWYFLLKVVNAGVHEVAL